MNTIRFALNTKDTNAEPVYANVDADDFERVCKHKWVKSGSYASTNIDHKPIRLHYFVLGISSVKGMVIDHIDGNGLNNCRSNLRHVSISDNNHNKQSGTAAKSGYRGVMQIKGGSWLGRIVYKNVMYGLGTYRTAQDAAKQYDRIAFRVYGIHAKTNNLLTDDEISVCVQSPLNADDLKIFKKNRELPTGISKRKNNTRFFVAVGSNTIGNFADLETAIAARQKYITERDETKLKLHMDKPIKRNANAFAVIELLDKHSELLGQTIVDEEQWHTLTLHSWCLSGGYAAARIAGALTLMHRFLMPSTDLLIDHINGNKLDNRKCNLRIVGHSDNGQNKEKRRGTSSKYIGVSWRVSKKKWAAEIRKDYKRFQLGYYATEEEAARAYDAKAKELFSNPKLNFG